METIRNLVDSYIQIVVKNLKDQVPKMIMHLMLNSARDFIAEELVAILYSECNGADLMKESQQEIERKECASLFRKKILIFDKNDGKSFLVMKNDACNRRKCLKFIIL